MTDRADLISVIEHRIDAHPRSQQKRIGPSELGTPCQRKLAHRLAQTPAARVRDAAWRPTVGTATHSWLTDAFNADNVNYSPVLPRWITSLRVPVGRIGDEMIDGELDLYDALTDTVIDFKVPGPTQIKAKRRAQYPGDEYRIQVHAYGRGLQYGFDITPASVGILFLPSNGELSESYYWSEAYDEEIAVAALGRATSLAISADALGGWDRLIPLTETASDNCQYCPWLVPGTEDLARACPGDPSMNASTTKAAPALVLATANTVTETT